MKITVSAIKADIGGIGGHTKPSKNLLKNVINFVNSSDLLIDNYVGYCGDDIHIIMTHTHGINNKNIHKLAWNAFESGTRVAKEEGLYGAGQDLLKDSFSGNVKGLGPGVAEIEFEERINETFTVLAADKTEPGAFNYPFYRLFIESRSNTGLIINESLSDGVIINIMDIEKSKIAKLELWKDKSIIEAALMYPSKYVVSSIFTKDNDPIVASSTDRLHNIAGKYVGKDDPICIIRTQKQFPATEETGSVFNESHYVAGNTRGSHNLPLMPVKLNSASSINFCIPIVEALVFSIHNGNMVGPIDGFATPDWDYVRHVATKRAFEMRKQGFIHPATLVPSELEYSEGYNKKMKLLQDKMKILE